MAREQVILITGAATGIGAALAQRYLRGGARVHIADANPAALREFLTAHPSATGSVTDVGNAADVERLFEDLRRCHGRLDVLINNAGIAGPTGAVESIAPADWERTIAVDLNGQFYCARLAVPLLRAAGGGSIVCIASTAALFGFPLRSPYAACKWAIIGFVKTLAMELGPAGIRVNAICPGSVEGPRIDAVIERDAASRGRSAAAIRDLYLRQTSMRTFVSKDDIAEMAWFLTSPGGARISGQAIAVDGHTEGLSNWLD